MKDYLLLLSSLGRAPLNICILYELNSLRMSYLIFFKFHKNEAIYENQMKLAEFKDTFVC